MSTEDKQLLLKDLCSRLPYGVKCRQFKLDSQICTLSADLLDKVENVEPYLRPLSSMNEEEEKEYHNTFRISMWDSVDWLLEHHFDYHNLIEKELALEAPKDMYKQ